MILLIGYGNPGRGDDGLGPALAQRIAARGLPGVRVLVAYQLMPEHALMVAEASGVVFADAWLGGTEPYRFAPLAASDRGDVTSHALSPETVLKLAATLYGAQPDAWILAIAGTEFHRVHEGLSDAAQRNLTVADNFLKTWLVDSCQLSRRHG